MTLWGKAVQAGVALAASLAVGALASCSERAGEDAEPRDLHVLAASSLAAVIADVASQYERESGLAVRVVLGGSPSLVRQVNEGAPADLLLTADRPSMLPAERAGLVDDVRVVASNRLSLMVAPGRAGAVGALSDLEDPDVAYAECARGVPCGDAAAKARAAAGVHSPPRSVEPNVAAVVTKVVAGEVDAGFVYRTDVAATAERHDVTSVSVSPAVTVDVTVAVVSDGATAEARRLLDHLDSDEGAAVLRRHGFEVP